MRTQRCVPHHSEQRNLVFPQELHSPLRATSTQGGGIHGNAILSRYDFLETDVLVHVVQPVDWPREGESFREPRNGARITPFARVQSPGAPMGVYGPHLELFCGASHRMAQMDEIMAHATEQAAGRTGDPLVIAGDFNTGAHGLGRAFPRFARDELRWGSLGYTEAEWWQQHYWATPSRNPLGFADPWDKTRDHTMRVEKYGIAIWRAKLDWVLLSAGVEAASWTMGGMHASDHAWLCVDLLLSPS